MVKIGNFFFRYRNVLFPFFYAFLVIPSSSIFSDYKVAWILGFSLSLFGQICRIATIGLEYIIRGGRDGKVYAQDLVTGGLFAHTRNPLYVGNVSILLGLGIMSNSLLFNLVFAPLFIFIYQSIILAEENFLRNKFGAAFDEYCSDTNRWLPKLSGIVKTLNSMKFNWNRVIIKEYNSAYIWLSGVLLIMLKTLFFLPSRTLFFEYGLYLFSGMVFLFLLYLFVRYLKKSKRLRAD